MSADPSDSAYDLAPVPRERERFTPSPPPEPLPLTYERPAKAIPPIAERADLDESTRTRKLTAGERMFYWMRRLGCPVVMGLGVLWLVFIDHQGFWGMSIGCGIIGVGFALLLFAGPSTSEKRGYHF